MFQPMKLKFGHLRCSRHDTVMGMPTSLSAQIFPFLLNIRERVEVEVGVNDLPLSEHPLDTAYSSCSFSGHSSLCEDGGRGSGDRGAHFPL